MRFIVLAAALLLVSCGSGDAPNASTEDEGGGAPPEQNIGERLFVETRFAEYFAAHMTDVNTPLATGDPVVRCRTSTAARCRDPSRVSPSTAARATL